VPEAVAIRRKPEAALAHQASASATWDIVRRSHGCDLPWLPSDRDQFLLHLIPPNRVVTLDQTRVDAASAQSN
jgi:hypothetical protein